MTAEEKKHYNNGFILGMASKGVIQKTIIIDGAMTDFSSPYTTISPTLENFIKEEEEE